MLSFKPTFSLHSFTFIKRLFSSSLSAVRVVSSANLRLLIFLPAILIPACASSSPAFLILGVLGPDLLDLGHLGLDTQREQGMGAQQVLVLDRERAEALPEEIRAPELVA